MTAHSSLPVLAGVDGTIRSLEAVRWAAQEAGRRGTGLTIVHASYLNYLAPPAGTAGDAKGADGTAGDGKGADGAGVDASLADAYEAAVEVSPELAVEVVTERQKPAHYLLRQSRQVAMIVLGTHPGNSLTGALLGSLSQTVAAHAVCPVVLVGGPLPGDEPESTDAGSAAPAERPVVVGISPRPGGREALRFALEEARLRGVALHAVRSWGDVDWGSSRLGYGSELFAEWRRMEANVLHNCLAEFEEEFPEVTIERELPGKRAQLALQHAAAGAQLLVVGCHRPDDHWFSRLGSVPSWLVHRSPCPLAIVGQPHRLPPEEPAVSETGQSQPVTA